LESLRAPAPVEEPPAGLREVGGAIALTVAYSDLFDHAPTVAEVRRLLIGVAATEAEVRAALDGGFAAAWVERAGEVCHLRGRRELVEKRRERQEVARRHWRIARRYLAVLEGFPFARMIAVTGGLSVNNVDADDDIDLFLVTAPGRLWVCRNFVVTLSRWTERSSPWLCPNFMVSTDRLEIGDRNLFTAHELFQMVPVAGYPIYRQILDQNPWASDYLPNAEPLPATRPAMGRAISGSGRRLLEGLLGGGIGRRFERWEMGRKIRRLEARRAGVAPGVEFGPDICRGHFEGHHDRAMTAFLERRRALGLAEFPVRMGENGAAGQNGE
jgi:hypothetical protein